MIVVCIARYRQLYRMNCRTPPPPLMHSAYMYMYIHVLDQLLASQPMVAFSRMKYIRID